MTSTIETTTPDFPAIKKRQQQTWASGDFSVVASRIVFRPSSCASPRTCRPGWRVLDVATGSGNAAIAAARRGCGRRRRRLRPGPARAGPQARRGRAPRRSSSSRATPRSCRSRTPSFDAVTSIYGSMFAPDHARAAAELVRVCRPGGRIALASWTPDGFIGDLFRTVSKHVPPPPGVESPMLWGTEDASPRALRRPDRVARGHRAHLHVEVRLGRGVRDLLPALVRANPEGVRGARRHEARCPRDRPDRAGQLI